MAPPTRTSHPPLYGITRLGAIAVQSRYADAFSSNDVDDVPIVCTVCLSKEGVIGTGRVWAFYPHRVHVESWLQISPGMSVSLFLHLPNAARVKLENGLVTWARAAEFGVQFICEPMKGVRADV